MWGLFISSNETCVTTSACSDLFDSADFTARTLALERVYNIYGCLIKVVWHKGQGKRIGHLSRKSRKALVVGSHTARAPG